MTKALVTLARGPEHEALLDIALPSFQEFADRHGYDLLIPELACDRPVSWWKVPALKAALGAYDEALWVDCDIVITDPSEDVTVPKDAWQAMVQHHTGDGDVPNCAVWYVRKPMVPVLDEVWAQTHRLNHGWWEQAAMLDLLGYQHHFRPAYLSIETPLYHRTHFLDNGFNHHKWDTPGPEHVRFCHATMHADRATVMRQWAAHGAPEAEPMGCRHRYPIEGCICAPFFAQQVAA